MRAVIVFVVFISGLGGTSLAQTAAQREACEADFQKFCEGVIPGGGRIMKCLEQHKEQLSPACLKVVTDAE